LSVSTRETMGAPGRACLGPMSGSAGPIPSPKILLPIEALQLQAGPYSRILEAITSRLMGFLGDWVRARF
jgi:hypothetical protein